MTQALLLIDLQNDYFPGGAMTLAGSLEAAERAADLLTAFRAQGLQVVHVQHLATRPGATFFLPGTEGCGFHPALRPAPGETVIRKQFPSAFRETPLLGHLRDCGIGSLVIAGMMTHMCIDSTTRAAADLGFDSTLAHDACATRALSFGGVTVPAAEVQTAYLAALDGTFARVLSTAAILATL